MKASPWRADFGSSVTASFLFVDAAKATHMISHLLKVIHSKTFRSVPKKIGPGS